MCLCHCLPPLMMMMTGTDRATAKDQLQSTTYKVRSQWINRRRRRRPRTNEWCQAEGTVQQEEDHQFEADEKGIIIIIIIHHPPTSYPLSVSACVSLVLLSPLLICCCPRWSERNVWNMNIWTVKLQSKRRRWRGRTQEQIKVYSPELKVSNFHDCLPC